MKTNLSKTMHITGLVCIAWFACMFSGCDEQPRPETATITVAAPQLEGARFRLTVVAEFADDLAYGGKRRIYEIADTKTGHTYLSVTGMGLDRLHAAEDAEELDDAAMDAAGIALDSMSD